jgi:hypothetical protein
MSLLKHIQVVVSATLPVPVVTLVLLGCLLVSQNHFTCHQVSIHHPSNNVAAAAALTMMSGQSRQPLRQKNNMANVAPSANSCISASSASDSASFDSQETCLFSPAAAQLQDHFDGRKEILDTVSNDDDDSYEEVIEDTPNKSTETSLQDIVSASPNVGPPEWGNINPDVIIKQC